MGLVKRRIIEATLPDMDRVATLAPL